MRTVLGRVLVIDDDPFMLKVICDLLEHAGFRVLVQTSAIGATQVIVRERIDAAIIDWNLPDLRGDDVVRLLRTWEQVKDLPVLLVSGAPEETLDRIRRELPGVHVLAKADLREELVDTLGDVVGSGKTVRGLAPVKRAANGDFSSAATRPRDVDLVPQLLTQLGGTMRLARSVWTGVTQGQLGRVEALVETLELLAGQARLLALEEAANLVQALADALRALPKDKKIPRDVRRAIEGGITALSALTQGSDGTFTVPPEPLIGALQRARAELSP